MNSHSEALRVTVESAVLRLMAIPESETEVRRDGEWCAKEVVGHLIDSAANNHARFVRAQLQEDLVFTGYDQGAWVRVTRALDEPWAALVTLWHDYNLHLAHIIAGIPDETLRRPWVRHSLDQIAWQPIPADRPATLEYLVLDYIGHLQDHVRQILALTGQPTG